MRTYYLCAGFSSSSPNLSVLWSLCLIKDITLLLTRRLANMSHCYPPSPSSLHQFTLHPFQLGLNSIYQVIFLSLLPLPSQNSYRAHYFPDGLQADLYGSSFSYSNVLSKVAGFSSTNADDKQTPQAGIWSLKSATVSLFSAIANLYLFMGSSSKPISPYLISHTHHRPVFLY